METYDFPKVTELAIPFFVVAILIELWLIRTGRAKGAFETRDTLTSLMMGTGNVVAGLLLGVVSYSALVWIWQFRLFALGLSVWVFVAAFLLDDLRYYWYHRIAHRVRWVWAEHVNHHSSQHYNLSTALRQSWTGLFTGMFVLQAPLVLLGFHPAVIAFVYGLNLVWQFWIHTETIGKMWPWFEFIFNTPSHHRVHHATNARYLDANYAGTLIIWDRLFGTFVGELQEDRPRYGIVRKSRHVQSAESRVSRVCQHIQGRLFDRPDLSRAPPVPLCTAWLEPRRLTRHLREPEGCLCRKESR